MQRRLVEALAHQVAIADSFVRLRPQFTPDILFRDAIEPARGTTASIRADLRELNRPCFESG